MILYIDIVSRKIISSPRLKRDVSRIEVKRGDVIPLSIMFVQNGQSVEINSDNVITFCAKLKNDNEGNPMVISNNFELVAENDNFLYYGFIQLNGVDLAAYLSNEEDSADDYAFVDLQMEVNWFNSESGENNTTNTTILRVYNDVFKGDELDPELIGTDPFIFPNGIKVNVIESINGNPVQIEGFGTAGHYDYEDFATAAQGTDERIPTAAGLTSKFSTAKATPVDNDRVAIFDSAASNAPKHTLWSSIKSTLKSYFDTIYAAIVHTHVSTDITDASVGELDESITDVIAKFDNYGGLTATSINTNVVNIYPNGTLSLASTNVGGSIILNGEAATDGRTIAFPDASGTVALTSDITDAVTSSTTSDGTCNLDVASLITGSINFNTAVPSDTAGVGELNWNDSDGTLNLGLKGGNVTLQIGQESVARVVNKTGANLLESQYKAVRIRSAADGGAVGQRLAVVLAQANNDANSVDTLGLVTENINNNQEGFVTTSGIVRGINTTGSLQGESWVDGDVLYLSPTTAGQLTKVKPQAPEHTVIMGYVLYAHNNQGKIYVKVDNGYELDELHNVRIVDATDGEVLLFNGTENVWQNFMLTPASIGLDQVDNTSDLDKPVSLATYESISPIFQDSAPEDSISVTLTDLGKTLTMYLSSGEITAGFPDYEGNDVDGWYWQLIRYLDSWILSVNDGVDDMYYAEMYYPTPTRFPWDAVVLGSASWDVTIGTTAPSISAPRIGTTVIEPQGTWMFNGKWRLIYDLHNVAGGGYEFLTAPTSGSLYSFLADKTGSGLSVFATSPTITTPTFAGASSFTSTTRPTSSGTGTPASNSLVTRNDVDSRGGRNISVTLSTDESGNQNTTTLKTATGLQMNLEAGTWDIECLIMVNCNNTSAGSRQKLNFSGTSSSFNGVVYGVDNGTTTTSTYPNARAVGSAVNYERVSSGASSATIRYGRLVATGSGVLSAQFAQAVATASTSPTLLAGSYIRAFKVA